MSHWPLFHLVIRRLLFRLVVSYIFLYLVLLLYIFIHMLTNITLFPFNVFIIKSARYNMADILPKNIVKDQAIIKMTVFLLIDPRGRMKY